MKIAIGSDHRGYDLRQIVADFLRSEGHEVEEFGAADHGIVDYPDIAVSVVGRIHQGNADRGILICGTGLGMCIVANKFPDIRAAACSNDVIAELSRRHNDANVLCLSGEMLGERSSISLVKKWLETEFEGGRHQTRIDKIHDIEKKKKGSV
ncbi:MAG: ribose 5-phosphate isomerase B [Planctomycetaceae bacterium]|nr:ribose 5-phosphate isomerase B [Planctomycetaceae bacterium]